MRRHYLLAGLLLLVYVGAYLRLSRRGYDQADEWNCKGFYYFTPEDTNAWRLKNYGCAFAFRPLNAIDRVLGTGKPPAAEPLYGVGQ
jgi:hypothetical protein